MLIINTKTICLHFALYVCDLFNSKGPSNQSLHGLVFIFRKYRDTNTTKKIILVYFIISLSIKYLLEMLFD